MTVTLSKHNEVLLRKIFKNFKRVESVCKHKKIAPSYKKSIRLEPKSIRLR